jgi:hypothetical protein
MHVRDTLRKMDEFRHVDVIDMTMTSTSARIDIRRDHRSALE